MGNNICFDLLNNIFYYRYMHVYISKVEPVATPYADWVRISDTCTG